MSGATGVNDTPVAVSLGLPRDGGFGGRTEVRRRLKPAPHCVTQWAAMRQWRVLGMLVVCVLINYLDRGNLSVSASNLTRDLGLTPSQMGLLLSAFFWTYAFCQLIAGWLLDRFDVYRVL